MPPFLPSLLVALALTPEWVRYLVHGNEAPLAVGLVLLGIDLHLDVVVRGGGCLAAAR